MSEEDLKETGINRVKVGSVFGQDITTHIGVSFLKKGMKN